MTLNQTPHPLDEPFCVITVEKPWSGTRKKDDEPRAFWVRDLASLNQALQERLRGSALDQFQQEIQSRFNSRESEGDFLKIFLTHPWNRALDDALTRAAFGPRSDPSDWRDSGAVNARFRYLNDLESYTNQGEGALVMRCLCVDPRDEGPLTNLISALGQSPDQLLELPCSPTSGSFVGSSFELWTEAIRSFHERLCLENAPASPTHNAAAKPRRGL